MGTCFFRSPLALHLQAFMDIRLASGRQGRSDRKLLSALDRFLMSDLKPGGTITREVAARYVDSTAHLSVNTRRNRMSVLRGFCLYLHHFDPRTCLIHRSFFPPRTRLAPHIYSSEEIQGIMAATKGIGPRGSLRPAVICTLVGLLVSTGVRIGEALKLTLADVDLRKGLLLIRESKFKKSRYVPLSPSASRHLAAFLRRRRKAGFAADPAAPVFVNPEGRPYGHPRVCSVFLEILRDLGLRGPKGQRGPRVHDLRHTFAVNRLLAWYQTGDEIWAKLPLLSTYMGHVTVTGTEIYLHATAELMDQANRRFHSHFAIPPFIREEGSNDGPRD
jgi:integrase